MLVKRIKYLVISNKRLVAALSFNFASLKIKSRDQYIGWSVKDRKKHLNKGVNNNRFLIFSWVKVHNLTSYTLSHTLNRLSDDWFNKYNTRPLLVETFIELSRYKGLVTRLQIGFMLEKPKVILKIEKNTNTMVILKGFIFIH